MNWDSIGRSTAAHVDATPTPGPSKKRLRESKRRVTARIVRTSDGEVIPEYAIGGETVSSHTALKERLEQQ